MKQDVHCVNQHVEQYVFCSEGIHCLQMLLFRNVLEPFSYEDHVLLVVFSSFFLLFLCISFYWAAGENDLY